MGIITEAMLRRRAEHNEGMLHSLEELVLQEEGIMEINKVLGLSCPNLKILYLPNNLIGKLGNLNRLKQLQYLNLAVNNIRKIEGLEHCEALEKLDLTLNFVDAKDLPSVASLRANVHLKDLFLTGNPCQDAPGYRSFVVAHLASLKRLDGAEIKPSERIKAQQEFPVLPEMLSGAAELESAIDSANEHVNEKGEIIRDYTPESRLAEYVELEAKKKDKTNTTKEKDKPPQRRSGFEPLPEDGRVYQKNEGGWSFMLTENDSGDKLVLDIAVGRYMDTSDMDVDVQPLLIRVLIRGKLLQLRLPEEVKTGQSTAQRSTTSGHLVISMPKVKVSKHRKSAAEPEVSYVLQKASRQQEESAAEKIRLEDVQSVAAMLGEKPQRAVPKEELELCDEDIPPLE